MRSHGFKAGTGTSSRVLRGQGDKEYTVGVIVQNNYGSMDDLQIDGVPVGRILKARQAKRKPEQSTPVAPESGKAAEGSK
jgi:D-aminopeptidase